MIFVVGDNDERVMLKVNSESAMFSHDNLRYFDAKINTKDIFYKQNLALEINNIKYNIKEDDLIEIQKALTYVVELGDDQGEFLKKWRKLNDNINN